jgi:ribosomal protein L11 methyltransferase
MTDRVPDRWLVLRVVRPEDETRAALLADALVELGGRAVWEAEGRLITHLPEPPDLQPFLDRTRRALSEAVSPRGVEPGAISLETDWQVHEDWGELWKSGLRPRRLTERLVVTPSWCSFDPRPGDLILTLDPGMAFGTAEHGTTRGCLRLLDRCVTAADQVLDVGAGSGILSIAAALLGATRVLALEADPWAVEPARENVEANGVSSVVRVEERHVTPDVLRGLGAWHGVVCNMEFGILRPLLSDLVKATLPGGWLVLSGALEHEWETLVALLGGVGAELEARDADGEWLSGLFRRVEPGP